MKNAQTDEHNDEIKLEVVEPSALEAINRAEVDIQISTAHRFPRSLQQFQKRAMSMATLDEETAASCLYRLTRREKGGGTKVIEGESIRMAEIVASSYGNMRIAAQITNQTPSRVTVRAVAHDLESNVLFAQEKMARTTYKDGNPYSDDMAVMIANATISKAIRDAIFRVVPKALIKSVTEAARQVAIGTAATLATRRGKAIEWARSLKIDMARVYAVLGVKGEADIGLEQLEVLTGLRTAIKEGDQTVDDAFPSLEKSDTSDKPEFAPVPDDEKEEAAAGLAPATPPPTPAPTVTPPPGERAPTPPRRRRQPAAPEPKVEPTPMNYPKALKDLLKAEQVEEADFINWCVNTQGLDDSITTIDEMEIVAPGKLHALVDEWSATKVDLVDWLGPAPTSTGAP